MSSSRLFSNAEKCCCNTSISFSTESAPGNGLESWFLDCRVNIFMVSCKQNHRYFLNYLKSKQPQSRAYDRVTWHSARDKFTKNHSITLTKCVCKKLSMATY